MWKNKLVWVTGASSGIGEALVQELAAKGAHLILSSRRQETLEQLCNSLPDRENHHVLPLDLANPQTLATALEAHKDLLSKVDALFNNAGISQRALTWEASSASERRVMEINFFGTVAITKAVLPAMVTRGTGSIIVMSSATGKFGFKLRSSYAASKHALHGYFESLRAELKGKDISITLVCPGRINTPISLNALTADGSAQNEMDPGLAVGIPAEVCARKTIRAAERGKAEIYIGKEQVLIYLNRYFPGLFRKVVRNINPK